MPELNSECRSVVGWERGGGGGGGKDSHMKRLGMLMIFVTSVKGARSRYFKYFCLILSIMGSKRQIGRARVFHLQNKGHITTENDFPAV